MIQTTYLRILIASDNTTLERRLRGIPVVSDITVDIRTGTVGEAWMADILIYDATSIAEALPEEIVCLDCILYAAADQITPTHLHHPLWTACWAAPVSDTMLAFYFRQILLSVQSKRELAVTRIFLDTLIDSVPDLVWFKDLRGSHLKVNEAFCRAVGKTKAQCEGRGHYYIWDLEPDEYAKGEYVCLETEEEVIRLNRTCLFDEQVKSKNDLRQFKTYKSPLVDRRGEMFGTVGIAKDVTDLRNVVQELEIILASIPFGAMIVNEEDSIIFVNQKFCEYFDITENELFAMRYSDVCTEILNTTSQQLESLHMTEIKYHHNGSQHVYHAQQQSIHDIFGNHSGFFFSCFDGTNEYELQDRLLRSANTDFMTGLYNRRYFYEAIGQITDEIQMSFVYFDLDNFKMVNDTYGHKRGDDAIILMAKLLREAFPKQLIARLGGDEFIVAFFGLSDAEELAQEVGAFIDRCGAIFRAIQTMEVLTVSAGIACNGRCQEVDALLSCADKALYAAKALGRARCTIYQESR